MTGMTASIDPLDEKNSLWAWYLVIRQVAFAAVILSLIVPAGWVVWKKHQDRHLMKDFIKEMGQFPVHFTFENITYSSFDDKQKPIDVSAPQAILSPKAKETLIMQHPIIHMHDTAGVPAQLTAEMGTYYQKQRFIKLEKNVAMNKGKAGGKENFIGQSQEMSVNLKNSVISLPQKATYVQTGSSLQAGKTTIKKQKQKIYFSDGVKMTILPQK